MSVKFMRKTAVAVAATALLGGGLTVGIGQGVAAAAETCDRTAHVVSDGFGTAKYNIFGEVVDDSKATPGGEVTVRTAVSKHSGAIGAVQTIGQFHPAGFDAIKAVSYKRQYIDWILSGSPEADRTETLEREADKNLVKVGFSDLAGALDGGNASVIDVTYKIPETAKAGQQYSFGFTARIRSGNWHEFQDAGPCFTVRSKNLMEGVEDVAGSVGISPDVFGSVTNPTGSISDVINGLDFGDLIGGIAGDLF